MNSKDDEAKLNRALQVLDCKSGVTREGVTKAYRLLVKVWHPDRFPADSSLLEAAAKKIQEINAAYEYVIEFLKTEADQISEAAPRKEPTPENPNRKASVEIDPATGKRRFKIRTSEVTFFDGRWRTVREREYVSAAVNENTTPDHAMAMSLCSQRPPSEAKTIRHYNLGGSSTFDLDAPYLDEQQGGGRTVQFPDGSLFTEMTISTDTLFHDPRKKCEWCKSSEKLKDLREGWEIYAKMSDWQTCSQIAGKAVKLHRENSWGWVQLSFALHNLQRTQEAHDNLITVADCFPGNETIPYNLACYTAQLGRVDDSRTWLKKSFLMALNQTPHQLECRAKRAESDPDLISLRSEIPKMAKRTRMFRGFF